MKFNLSTCLVAAGALALGSAASANLISEFEPNPTGADPAIASVELSGTPGAAFSGVLVSIESDPGGANPGDVNAFFQVSGTYDAAGLAVVEIDDLENPSFTFVFAETFSGDIDTDFDADDDGVADTVDSLGTVFDAIGISDNESDLTLLYAAQLGGTDLQTQGDPTLVFRDGVNGDLYAVLGGTVFDAAATEVTSPFFGGDPTATSFGAVNPTVVPEPASLALLGLGAAAMLRRRSA